ncbi:MAG: hypothetical protein N3D74_05820 [Caldisericia bacterium]|nr:hypothetical protein [Caldisericia bacterium]
MKASKILFLYNLTLILNWFLVSFLLINILFKNIFLSILIPAFFFIFIPSFKNINIETTLKILISIFSIFMIFITNTPITFQIFLKILLFSFIYILSLITLKTEISNYLSIILIAIILFFYERFIGTNLLIFILSFIFIIQSIFLNFFKNKTYYFWENNFLMKTSQGKRIFKNLILISLISIILISMISSININFINKLTLPSDFILNRNENLQEEKNFETKDSKITIFTKRYIFRISDFSRKFLNFLFNSFYLILFLGIFVILILFGIKFYNLIKAVYGKEKSKRFLISSFIISVSIILSIYFLYKPFEILIRSIVKNTKIEEISIPLFEIIQKIRNFFSSNSNINQKTLPISIDFGLIFVVLTFIIASTIFLYFLIFYMYKSNFNERKLELNKIIEEFSNEKDEIFEISGTPREKIIKLYNILIKKLSLIILKLDYETPNEYRLKFKKEKPELSNEIDLITDNFIISKYSYYDISDESFNKTFLAFKKLGSKIFKEVYFGREI